MKLESKFLSEDIVSTLSAETSADSSDLLLLSDSSGTVLNKITKENFLDGAGAGECLFCEIHDVSSAEVTAGYFILTHTPVNINNVTAYQKGIGYGTVYANKQCVGSSGESPDFDILNGNEFHINNNGDATGLSGVINDTDDVIILYSYSKAAQYSVLFNTQLTVNGTYSGITTRGTVDGNSTGFSAALYIASDFHYEEVDADTSSTMICTALALETGTGSNKLLLLEGAICNTSWNWSAGRIWVSTTTGALTQTKPSGSGDRVQVVGYALSADCMYFNPSMEDIGIV